MAASSNCSAFGGKFKATRIWNTLVHHMQDNVNVKRRKNTKKCYDECFTGCNAVEVLHVFVRRNPELFSNATTLARENITRLCQSFLDMGVIEGVATNGDGEKVTRFEDSATSLYFFMDKSRRDDNSNNSLRGRKVLREIDGELRNSIGDISLSNSDKIRLENSSKDSSSFSVTMRNKSENRSRFPSFGKLRGQSLKETFRQSVIMREKDEDTNSRGGRKLKRTSSFAGMAVRRSTSDPNLRQLAASASSGSDTDYSIEDKDKKSATLGASFISKRLSQRLSFRRKSGSSNLPVKLLAASAIEQDTSASNLAKSDDEKQLFHRFDPTRKSVPMKLESSKPRRSLRRMISSPSLINKMMQRSKIYDISNETDANVKPPCHELSSNKSTPKNKRVQKSHWTYGSPCKVVKKNEIMETPSRVKSSKQSNNLPAFSSFAHRMSVRRRSVRKSESAREERNTDSGDQSMSSQEEPVPNNTLRQLSTQELSHMRRECIRVRLLQVLDIPFVENVVVSPALEKKLTEFPVPSAPSAHQMPYSEVVASYDSSDAWISSALEVLQYIPNSYELLCRHARDSQHIKKMKLFFAISDYYKSMNSSLVDQRFADVVNAIIGTLETRPVSESMEALQLFLHLLPHNFFSQLRHLVNFLHCVVTSDDVTLTPRCSNASLVFQTFPGIIFPSPSRHCDVTDGMAGLLRLTIEQRHMAFQLPANVDSTIARKRHLLETGEADSPSMIPSSTFSVTLSAAEFAKEAAVSTRAHVAGLARFVLSDRNVPHRRKKDFLKKLQSSHPSVYSAVQPLKPTYNPETPASGKAPVAPHVHPSVTLRTPNSDLLPRRRNKSRKSAYV